MKVERFENQVVKSQHLTDPVYKQLVSEKVIQFSQKIQRMKRSQRPQQDSDAAALSAVEPVVCLQRKTKPLAPCLGLSIKGWTHEGRTSPLPQRTHLQALGREFKLLNT